MYVHVIYIRYLSRHWKMLVLRCYDSGETMAMVQIHPQDLAPVRVQRLMSLILHKGFLSPSFIALGLALEIL